ncbi:uncharacterized protein BJ171DRAFT_532555 [Polychytrium aggregatum]|uniref:uncharacterized protein n=1 Tax=Polychytrium aggregatum TaxID=110093 RepID=UPI0022FE4675|nr:uncharacterized protein BJ171DRAFT_532555 [Polychytrium aggregatum]KAI9193149.1 hypothetical protein BJ171DRAFT_532555 [Polychytrium aggregatum]
MSKRKVVCVGDEGVGKTCMVLRLLNGSFQEEHVATLEESYSLPSQPDLEICDTAGAVAFDRLRPYAYERASSFLICFAVDSIPSFKSVEEKFVPEVRYYCPNRPFAVVGLKSDARDKAARESPGGGSPESGFVTFEMGLELAKKMSATRYVECSSLSGDGIQTVFGGLDSDINTDEDNFITEVGRRRAKSLTPASAKIVRDVGKAHEHDDDDDNDHSKSEARKHDSKTSASSRHRKDGSDPDVSDRTRTDRTKKERSTAARSSHVADKDDSRNSRRNRDPSAPASERRKRDPSAAPLKRSDTTHRKTQSMSSSTAAGAKPAVRTSTVSKDTSSSGEARSPRSSAINGTSSLSRTTTAPSSSATRVRSSTFTSPDTAPPRGSSTAYSSSSTLRKRASISTISTASRRQSAVSAENPPTPPEKTLRSARSISRLDRAAASPTPSASAPNSRRSSIRPGPEPLSASVVQTAASTNALRASPEPVEAGIPAPAVPVARPRSVSSAATVGSSTSTPVPPKRVSRITPTPAPAAAASKRQPQQPTPPLSPAPQAPPTPPAKERRVPVWERLASSVNDKRKGAEAKTGNHGGGWK